MSASRVAQVVRVPRVVFSTVVVVGCHPRRFGGRRGGRSAAAEQEQEVSASATGLADFGLVSGGWSVQILWVKENHDKKLPQLATSRRTY